MAKLTINVGNTPNDRKGDSLRAAFQKVNANFSELYTELGLDSGGLNLGAFEFTGSVMSTTDSSGITIDQAVTVTSDLTVSGDVVPAVAQGGDLGSASRPWRSLHVSANTVFLGGVPLGLETGTNELTINNVPISQTITYADIPNAPTIPADISDLTDTGNLLSAGSADSLTSNDDINITINNDDSSTYVWNFGQTGDLTLPAGGDILDSTGTSVLGGGSADTGTIDFAGNTISGTDEVLIGDALNFIRVREDGGENSAGVRLQNRSVDEVLSQYTVNTHFTAGELVNSNGDSRVQFNTTNADLIADIDNFFNADQNELIVTDGVDTFTFTNDTRVGSSYDGVSSFSFTFNVPPPDSTRVLTQISLNLFTTRTNSIILEQNDFSVSVTDDVSITGSDSFRLRNRSSSEPIRIITAYDDNDHTWAFEADGTLTIPGDIQSDNDINITINNDDSSSYTWNFGQTGDLSLPGGLLGQVWGDGIDTELTLKSPPGVGDSGYVALSSANERNYVEVSNIGVVLGVEFGQAGFKKLTFGTDGNLKSADGEPLQIFSTGAGGAVSLAWSSSLDSPENIALIIANSPGAQTSGAVDIVVGAIAGPNIWTFNPSGALTIPGDIQSENDISLRVNLSDSTTRTWRFGEDGDLAFPDSTVQTTAFAGNAATVDITNTNGLDTNYSITFVENRDATQILRADVDLTFNSATNILTAGNVTTGILKINDGVHEQYQTKADATGVVTHDCALGHIIYHTSPDDYFTVNLTNLNLASGYATSITVVMVQGATGYGPDALQIGGVAQTINWQGGSLPAAPTANGVDVLVFSILNNSGTYTVLAQATGFNEVA